MKIQGSKKTAIIVLVIFISVLLIVLAIVLYSNLVKKYPEEPLKMKNLGKTSQNIDISSLEIKTKENDVPVYFVEPKLHIDMVEKMINKLGISLSRNDIVPNSYIEWGDSGNTFTYDAVSDSVTFNLLKGISIERGNGSFSKFFKEYLDTEYEFTSFQEKKNANGGITYYASRMINDIPVQYGAGYEYTDILEFDKDGSLISAKLLLAQIDKYDVYLPLITKSELDKYINTSEYPKEHYVDSSVLADILNIYYLDDKWEKIEDTLKDCKAQSSDLIFLYKTSNQGYLLPVFKISANCTVSNEGNDYTVPATFYVNAADPKYVTL